MSDQIYFFDTTLRDGEQCPGASMNLREKLEVARQMERLGMDVIEAGFPCISDGDFEAVHTIAREIKKCRIAGLARCVKADIEAAAKALDPAGERARIHIFLATSKLHMQFKLKKAETMLPAGYTVAKNQLVVRPYKAPELKLANVEKVNVATVTPVITENDYNYLIVTGENFRIEFNKHDGFLCKYDVKGQALIDEGGKLTPNFWRAPTDNDMGAGLQNRYAAWKKPGLKLTSLTNKMENGQAVVNAEYTMEAVSAKLSVSYTINNEGAVKVTQKMIADKSAKVSDMFRFGMQFRMPLAFNEIEYYGRGPVENYSDRNHAAMLGKYRQTVEEQFYPYIRPQETGTKTDIRWWRLLNIGGNGLQFVADAPFSASALNYTIESLDDGAGKDQRHSPEVEKANFTNFCIDKAQTGLACVNSWGAIALEKYRLPYQDYEFSFIMNPVYHKLK